MPARRSRKQAEAESVVAPVAEPEPEPEQVVEAEDGNEETFDSLVSEVEDEIRRLRSAVSALSGRLGKMKKQYKADVKKAQKQRGGKRRNPNGQSGFHKPSLLSDKLCSFMGIPTGSQRSRIEVIRFISAYIKENKVADPSNGKIIRAKQDKKMNDLLQPKNGEQVTYFNLQKYLKPHITSVKSS